MGFINEQAKADVPKAERDYFDDRDDAHENKLQLGGFVPISDRNERVPSWNFATPRDPHDRPPGRKGTQRQADARPHGTQPG